MIICIVENSSEWNEYGQPYLLETGNLTNEKLRAILELSPYSDTLIPSVELEGLANSEGWFEEVILDLEQAIVHPPQMVDKLISVIFE